jgi:hypothetical protein
MAFAGLFNREPPKSAKEQQREWDRQFARCVRSIQREEKSLQLIIIQNR